MNKGKIVLKEVKQIKFKIIISNDTIFEPGAIYFLNTEKFKLLDLDKQEENLQ